MEITDTIIHSITSATDFICGYPLFVLLIGGGIILFAYSRAIPIRCFGQAIKSLRQKENGEGQISSFQALMTTISSTVGMGNIAGVAIAIAIGGPGTIFWMWISALVGMSTKFFEGTLAILYKGKDNLGETQGGPMYIMTEGLGRRWKPLAVCFSCFALVGCLCTMQANQLTESIITVFTTPAGIPDSFTLKLFIGLCIGSIVAIVVIGGIQRISIIASKVAPVMVTLYFILVTTVIILNIHRLPDVFIRIFSEAFNLQAGWGALAGVAITGARRAMYVNEAGVGTASLMHGASKNNCPAKEGLIAMLGPAIDSGFVCTLTAIPILMADNYHIAGEGVKGLTIALNAYNQLLPGFGQYILMVIVAIFAFSTMFSYSYYGTKCFGYLFGMQNARHYNYFYLFMLILACIISLDTAISIMDLAFALMAFCTMFTIFRLAPKVKLEMKKSHLLK